MRTNEEINHFIGFCEIIGDDFAVKVINILCQMSERDLQSFRQILSSCIPSKKPYLLVDGTKPLVLKGKQRIVTLNILDWLENV